eukprot:3888209-Pleurochrysis_carterae.AAC.2
MMKCLSASAFHCTIKSFLPHGAVYKQSAKTRRVATLSGSERRVLSAEGNHRQSMRGKQGAAKMVKTKEYSTNLGLSSLKNWLATQQHRKGERLVTN